MGNHHCQPALPVYRIPSLLYMKESKNLLAFAEKRKTKNDASAEALVMKTGTLNHESVQWSQMKEIGEAHLPGHRPMNPCPVYERNYKTLFLFFICVETNATEFSQLFFGKNKARLCYIKSQDEGKTWGQVTDLTDQDPLKDVIKNWTTFAVGPGHGIQTESGLLIIPSYAYHPRAPFYRSTPYAVSVYSEDSGKTWQIGKQLQKQSIECEMAEVLDATGQSCVYCNARTKERYRVEALSRNGGDDFNILPSGDKLVETSKYGGCQGSVIGFPALAESEQTSGGTSPTRAKTWLLYSHPTSRTKRVDLGVYLNCSPPDPAAWTDPWIIHRGPSAYSDLAYLDNGTFACLMEHGEHNESEQISLMVFTYNDIKQGHEKVKHPVFP